MRMSLRKFRDALIVMGAFLAVIWVLQVANCVGLVAGALYWTILQVAIPGTPGVSWIGHLGGLVGGVLAAWLLRNAGPARRPVTKPRPQPASSPGGPGGKPVDDLLRDLK